MLTEHRPVVRRRTRRGRIARIAVPLAIPVALGVTLGVIIANSGGNQTNVNQSAFHRFHSPTASASPSASASASTSPAASATASTSASAAAAVAPASSFANGPIATRQLGDVATAPVDGTGAAISLTQTAAQAEIGRAHV